jgi:hypothetical protein
MRHISLFGGDGNAAWCDLCRYLIAVCDRAAAYTGGRARGGGNRRRLHSELTLDIDPSRPKLDPFALCFWLGKLVTIDRLN